MTALQVPRILAVWLVGGGQLVARVEVVATETIAAQHQDLAFCVTVLRSQSRYGL